MGGVYAQFRHFPRTIRFFYIADIFFAFSMAIFTTLFNLHLLQIGYNAGFIGTLNAVSSIITAAVAIPIGLAGDRWGRRRLYVAGSFLYGVPYMVLPFVRQSGLILILYTVYSIGNALMFVNESPLLSGEVGPDLRARVFNFMVFNYFVWTTAGTQLAGFLTEWLPPGALSRYQWPLVIAGLCALSAATVRALLPFRPESPSGDRIRLRPTRTSLKLGAASLLIGGGYALTQNFMNVVLAERFGFSPSAVATALTVAGLVGWLGSFLVPWASKRLGDLKSFALVMAVQGMILAFMSAARTPGAFLPGLWGRSIVGTMQQSLWLAVAMGVTPAGERATANSYAQVGRSLGIALASRAYGSALAGGSFAASFLAAAACTFGAALFTRFAFRQTKFD